MSPSEINLKIITYQNIHFGSHSLCNPHMPLTLFSLLEKSFLLFSFVGKTLIFKNVIK